MAKYGFTATIGADTTALNEKLQEIQKKTKSLNSELKSVNTALKFDSENVTLANQRMEILKERSENANKELSELLGLQEDMDKALKSKDITDSYYRQYQREIEQCKASVATYENEINRKAQAEAEAAEAAKKAAEEAKAVAEAEEKAAAEAAALAEAERKSKEEAEAAAKAQEKYDKSLEDLKKSASKVKDDISGIAQTAATAVAAVGGAAAAGISASIDVGTEFTASMSNVAAISGAAGDELEQLEEKAKEMGASTSKTAAESADALSYMALAGWNTEEMLEGLEPVLRASEAGSMDLATCSDLVTDSMSALGLSTEDLSHYLDVLAAAQSNSNTSLEGILEAYIECGGTMKSLGVSIEESATLLGTLANRGMKASEAGNSLNSILVNLTGGSSKAAGALDELGISAWDSEGNFRGIETVLSELSVALENCTQEQATLFESALGGKTQLTTLQALISGIEDEYDDLYATLSNADGALLSTAETMQDNLTGDITKFTSALEGLGIMVFENLEEPLRNAVNAAIEKITELNESATDGEVAAALERIAIQLSEFIEKSAEFAADKGIPMLIDALDWISQNGDTIVTIVKTLGVAWAAWKVTSLAADVYTLINNLILYKAAAAEATVEQKALNTAMQANVVAAVATATIALGTALASLAKSYIETRTEAEIAKKAYSDTTTELIGQATAARQAKAELNDTFEGIDQNTTSCKALWQELQSLVDAEGNVGENGEKVNSVITQLNELAGTNISIVNGQVQAYSELCDTMDDYIEKMRLEAKLDALKEGYGEALTNVDEQKAAIQSK